jgi:AcrR family transcriptional regulator
MLLGFDRSVKQAIAAAAPIWRRHLKASMPAPHSELRWDARTSVDDRRDQILRSLAAFARDRRLASLTMRDIADRLGLVKGNLYYYFKNKQDILFHCHVKCIEISLAALDEVRATQSPPAERLRTLLVKHIRNITEDAYGGVLLTDLESLTPAQRKRYVAMRDRFERGVREMIRDGIAAGEFAPQNIDLAGITILGAINWIPKWYRSSGALSSAEIAESIADQLIRSLRR